MSDPEIVAQVRKLWEGMPPPIALATAIEGMAARYAARELRQLAPSFCAWCRREPDTLHDNEQGEFVHRLRQGPGDWDITPCAANALHQRAHDIEKDHIALVTA